MRRGSPSGDSSAAPRDAARNPDDFRERLSRIVERDGPEQEAGPAEPSDLSRAQERLRDTLGKARGSEAEAGGDTESGKKPSIRERLDDVLHKPRDTLTHEDDLEQDRDEEIENTRDRDRGIGDGHGL